VISTRNAGRSARQQRRLRDLEDLLRRAGVAQRDLRGYIAAVRRYSSRRGISGIDFGAKIVAGEIPAHAPLAIRFHVRQKRPMARVPRAERLPSEVNGVATDVVQRRDAPHHAFDRRARCDPMQPGVSVCHAAGTPGTVGMFVRGIGNDAASLYLLSADHVLAQGTKPRAGDSILQPGVGGVRGGRCPARRSILYDAAVARLNANVAFQNIVAESNDLIDGSEFPFIGMPLLMSGLKTDGTTGVVEGIGLFEGLGPSMLLRPFGNPPFAQPGDSGAVWYEPSTGRAVGLHVRGNLPGDPNPFAIATSVVKLCQELDVDPTVAAV
jgi:hypothetical protein